MVEACCILTSMACQVMVPRQSYLPLCVEQVVEQFRECAPPLATDVWFEHKGEPLRWYSEHWRLLYECGHLISHALLFPPRPGNCLLVCCMTCMHVQFNARQRPHHQHHQAVLVQHPLLLLLLLPPTRQGHPAHRRRRHHQHQQVGRVAKNCPGTSLCTFKASPSAPFSSMKGLTT